MRRTLLALVLVLVLAPAANAATIEVGTYLECNGDLSCEKYMAGTPTTMVTFRGAPGEASRLVVERAAGGRLRVADAGATIDQEPKCEHLSEHEALCPYPGQAIVDLGDGDDVARLDTGTKTFGDGGPGDDILQGGASSERLYGGAGRDRLEGGGGDDTLVGTDSGTDTDVLDGGDGDDTATYASRSEPVVLALGGGASNVDRLTGIEGVVGGSGDDTLTGSDADESLDGGAGDDTILGGGGDDAITGGAGSDGLAGGAGDDTIASDDDEPDTIACGAGRDLLAQFHTGAEIYDDFDPGWGELDPRDVLANDCERAVLDGSETRPRVIDPRVRIARRTIRLRNPCATLTGRPCSGTVRVAGVRRRFRAGTPFVRLPLRHRPRRLRIGVAVRPGRYVTRIAWTVG